MKPAFHMGSYFGGKGAAGVVHRIINQIPKHRVFVSGFLGHCSVMRWKIPAELNIGFDLDPSVIAKWRDTAAAGVTIHQANFIECISSLEILNIERTFLYLDPPYLMQTRQSANKYLYELTDEQHVQLLTACKKLRCMVAISCYDSDLYRAELSTWRKIQFSSQTRGGKRLETLYMNYPEPSPDGLHDPRFLGENFRAREKGKRRIETIKSKIERLAPEEKARLSDWLKLQV